MFTNVNDSCVVLTNDIPVTISKARVAKCDVWALRAGATYYYRTCYSCCPSILGLPMPLGVNVYPVNRYCFYPDHEADVASVTDVSVPDTTDDILLDDVVVTDYDLLPAPTSIVECARVACWEYLTDVGYYSDTESYLRIAYLRQVFTRYRSLSFTGSDYSQLEITTNRAMS